MSSSGKRKIVGIDLGTTYSAIAHFDEYGKVDIIPNSENERTTPSVVLFEDGQAVVGKIAKNQAIGNPKKAIQFVKRHMGQDWSTEIDGHRFTPELVSSLILKRIVMDAEEQLGQRVTDVVITCPAYFNDNERSLTKLAGKIAGLNVLGIVNEPTAAAIAYGLNNRGKQLKVLVFDLGGGTLDVTVLEIKGDDVKVLATDGERRLGGKDWDDVLIEKVAETFQIEHDIDPRKDPESYQDLIIRVEDAKKALSIKPRAKTFLRCEGASLKFEVTRDQFETWTKRLVQRAETRLESTLQKAKLAWGDIDVLLRVGGSTRMPMIQTMLEKKCKGKLEKGVHPDEVVAMGAVYWGAIVMVREAKRLKKAAGDRRTGRYKKANLIEDSVPDDLIVIVGDMDVKNVNSHSLGIQAVDPRGRHTNRVMIREQTPIPTSITKEFVTQLDDQKTVEIRILEGAHKDPDKCVNIGTCVISGLPPKRPKGSKIHVTYSYREDGVVAIHAQDVDSGKEVRTEITRQVVPNTQSDLDFMGRKVTHLLKFGEDSDSDPDFHVYDPDSYDLQ